MKKMGQMRRSYESPRIKVDKLDYVGLICTSGTEATRNGYGEANEDTWGDDEPAGAKSNNSLFDYGWGN